MARGAQLIRSIDLDALRTEALGAVDYRQPDGLAWDEVDRLAATAANSAGCRWASVVIYNPDLDPDRVDARKVVAFLSRLMASLTGSVGPSQ